MATIGDIRSVKTQYKLCVHIGILDIIHVTQSLTCVTSSIDWFYKLDLMSLLYNKKCLIPAPVLKTDQIRSCRPVLLFRKSNRLSDYCNFKANATFSCHCGEINMPFQKCTLYEKLSQSRDQQTGSCSAANGDATENSNLAFYFKLPSAGILVSCHISIYKNYHIYTHIYVYI